MTAREVPLRLAKTAVHSQLKRGKPAVSPFSYLRGVWTCVPSLLPPSFLSFPFPPHMAHLSWQLGDSK